VLCLCADRPRAMVDVALAPSTLISARRSALSETAKANICPRRKPQSPRRWASALPQRQPTKARPLPSTEAARRAAPRIEAGRLALSIAKPNDAAPALARGRDAVEARVGRVSTRRLHGTALLIGALRRSKRALEPDGDNTPAGQYALHVKPGGQDPAYAKPVVQDSTHANPAGQYALHVKPGGQDPPYAGGRSSWLSVLANEWGSSWACMGGVRGVARRARSPAPFRLSPEAPVRSTPRALCAANAPSYPQRRQQPWT